MSELIVSVSGLRGVIGEQLNPELAARFAVAYAFGQPEGALVLSRDGRATGGLLCDAIRAALQASGRDVVDIGVAATPTAGILVRSEGAAGGIQVSASHNPAEYNGIKLFSEQGCVLSAAAGSEVLARFESGCAGWVAYDRIGQSRSLDDTTSEHARSVMGRVDVDAIRACGFRVVLDSNHASGSRLGKILLEELGCQVTAIGDQLDGQFAHRPEPTEENLRGICRRVTDERAAVGFCQDPDADRLAVIDEQGRYVGEEYTLALCLDQVLSENPGPVVTNCSTSRMAGDLADKYGTVCHLAAVGEANVVEQMRRQQAVFGGEGNGGPIDPEVGMIRDSFVGMAWILHAMAKRGESISELAQRLPKYAICKQKQPIDRERLEAAQAALERRFSNARLNRLDGLRLDWDDRWLLVRASNTEPIMRIIAEAKTESEASELCAAAAAIIAGV